MRLASVGPVLVSFAFSLGDAIAFSSTPPSPLPVDGGSTFPGSASFGQASPHVAAFGSQGFCAVWADYRASDWLPQIWGATAGFQGPLLTAGVGSAPLTVGRAGRFDATVGCGPTQCLVAWREGTGSLYVQRFDISLAPVDPSPVLLTNCGGLQCGNPTIAWEGADWLVAYWNQNGPSVLGHRVSSAGIVDPVELYFGATVFSASPAVACDGTSTLAVWPDLDGGVAHGGFPVGSSIPLMLTNLITPAVSVLATGLGAAFDGGFFAAWQQQDTSGSQSIHGQRLAPNATGAPLTLASNGQENGRIPVTVAQGVASTFYFDTSSNTGQLAAQVSMTTGASLGVLDAGLPALYDYMFDAAALPNGPQLVVSDSFGEPGGTYLVALDVGPLRALDAGALVPVPVGHRGGAAVWTGAAFLAFALEESSVERTPVAFQVSPIGAVGPRVPLGFNPFLTDPLHDPIAVPFDGGAVVAWSFYWTVDLSTVDRQLNQGGPSTFNGANLNLNTFGPPALSVVGNTLLAALTAQQGVCLLESSLPLTTNANWAVQCETLIAPTGVSLASARGETLIAATLADGTVEETVSSLSMTPLDAGALLSSGTVIPGANSQIIDAASDGSGFLVTWWSPSFMNETVGAAVIDGDGGVTAITTVSSRSLPPQVGRGSPLPRPWVVHDAVSYVVAYSAPGADGGFDAFLRRVYSDGGLGPEWTLVANGYDQQVEALAAGTPGRVLALTRGFDPIAGAQRTVATVLAEVPLGSPCFAPGECIAGACISGVCQGVDGGSAVDGGGTVADSGTAADGGSSVDAGPSSDAGGAAARKVETVGCGCQQGGTGLWLAGLALASGIALGKRRRCGRRLGAGEDRACPRRKTPSSFAAIS